MPFFEFSNRAIEKVIEELGTAQKYIKIAIFQLHNKKIFDFLKIKLNEGIEVEILTLPYDSVNIDMREKVTERFEEIKTLGAKLFFNRWNIGDPSRTTTAVGRWYSFHGKFIVTDKSAIALSANFTEQDEIDALIILNEKEVIEEFNSKFDELKNRFITGKIREEIETSSFPNSDKLFKLPSGIDPSVHGDYWITDYPGELCNTTNELNQKLYICPFDIRARTLLTNIIDEAKNFIYISSESFTDPEIADYLISKKLINKISIKVLCGTESMDFSDRLNIIFKKIIASGIELSTTDDDLHGKIIITENCLSVNSINLNKINLGFARTSKIWRGNTETAYVTKDSQLIVTAKKNFEKIYNSSINVISELIRKNIKEINIVFSQYGLKSKNEVKHLFSKLMLFEEFNVIQKKNKIGNYVSKIMQAQKKNTVTLIDLYQAIVLLFLAERKHSYKELEEKIKIFGDPNILSDVIDQLLSHDYIEQDGDFYMLKVLSLFKVP